MIPFKIYKILLVFRLAMSKDLQMIINYSSKFSKNLLMLCNKIIVLWFNKIKKLQKWKKMMKVRKFSIWKLKELQIIIKKKLINYKELILD